MSNIYMTCRSEMNFTTLAIVLGHAQAPKNPLLSNYPAIVLEPYT